MTLQRQWLQQGVGLLGLPGALAGAFEGHNRGYYYLVGLLYYFVGSPYRMPAALLNCFFGALTVVVAYRTAGALFSSWVATRVGWWTCLIPSMLIWSAQTVKEPVVIFLETLALYGCIRLRQRGIAPGHLALCAAATLLLFPFRFYATYIVGAAVLFTLLLPTSARQRRTLSPALLALLLLPVVVGAGLFAQREAQQERFDLDRVQRFREDVSTAGAGQGARSGVRTADVHTTGGLIVGVTVGAAHLLLAPFPWELGGASLRMLLTLPELVAWWWLFFVGVVPGARFALRRRLLDVSTMLILMLGFGLLYSLMFGNVGLIFRQRAQLLPWLLIFGAVGLEQRLHQRRAAQRRSSPPLVPLEAQRLWQ